ncbi:DUF2987 domain-containing protein [Enterovibrio calviensis]|uniref:DUF2987 domain-containing protein n=1 Tax=Enterovibrio calviensis TaxID=91359 RepID=UPI0004830350|nr:DUF2987 domain-containing protein [Enterovibrio calviensis]
MIKGLTAAVIAAVISLPVSAAQIEFSYSKLYSQLKHNLGENHPDVKIGYFMVAPETGEICTITKAWMIKKKNYEEFVIPDSQELPLPIDNRLRQVNPDVFIQTEGETLCDVSFQVMAKNTFEAELSEQELGTLVPQMTAMMQDLGGMFSSWFMPDVEGVSVHFDQPLTSLSTSEGRVIDVTGKVAVVKLADLNDGERVLFEQAPVKVTPWIPQS